MAKSFLNKSGVSAKTLTLKRGESISDGLIRLASAGWLGLSPNAVFIDGREVRPR